VAVLEVLVVALFQWQSIDPAPAEVERALVEAGRDAGRPTVAERRTTLDQAGRSKSGSRSWGELPRRVGCTWWTDHVGRRHWYVEADEYRPFESNPMWRCRQGAAAHPLCVIDPLHTAVRGKGKAAALLVVCDCGEVGTPVALGWTGDCCSPCFDRRAEGTGPPGSLAVQPHWTEVIGLAFTRDGRVLSVGYRDGAVHLHDPSTGLGRLLVEPSDRGGAGVVVLPSNEAVVAYNRGEVECWDIASGELIWGVVGPGELMGLAASPDGERLAVDAATISFLYDAQTGDNEFGPEELSNFAYAPDGTLYAYHSDERAVVVVHDLTGEVSATGLEFGEPEEDDCYGLALSPTGALVASGGNDGRVKVGDPRTGRWLHTLKRPAGLVSALAFAPDGTLASDHDGEVLFWDVAAGVEVGRLGVSAGAGVNSLAFSPDGEMLAVGDTHGVVRLWPWQRMLGARG
jgi:hypothetical protein